MKELIKIKNFNTLSPQWMGLLTWFMTVINKEIYNTHYITPYRNVWNYRYVCIEMFVSKLNFFFSN